jgi:hypothetical protein
VADRPDFAAQIAGTSSFVAVRAGWERAAAGLKPHLGNPVEAFAQQARGTTRRRWLGTKNFVSSSRPAMSYLNTAPTRAGSMPNAAARNFNASD